MDRLMRICDEAKYQRFTTEERKKAKIIGKICPCCGQVGLVVFESEIRIIFECPNGHQYEVKRLGDLPGR